MFLSKIGPQNGTALNAFPHGSVSAWRRSGKCRSRTRPGRSRCPGILLICSRPTEAWLEGYHRTQKNTASLTLDSRLGVSHWPYMDQSGLGVRLDQAPPLVHARGVSVPRPPRILHRRFVPFIFEKPYSTSSGHAPPPPPAVFSGNVCWKDGTVGPLIGFHSEKKWSTHGRVPYVWTHLWLGAHSTRLVDGSVGFGIFQAGLTFSVELLRIHTTSFSNANFIPSLELP